MRVFAVGALVLVTIFSLMLGISMLIGHLQPNPIRVNRLHLVDCSLPCWNGILPGVSSPGDAQNRIHTSFPDFGTSSGTADSKFLTWTETDDLNRIVSVLDVTFQNDLVATIGLGTDHVSSEMPNLGEVLSVYGAPTCVTIDAVTDHSNWFYENSDHHIILQFSVLPLSMASPVNNFVFGFANNASCQNISAMPWHDYRNVQRLFVLFFEVS